mgnify:FL=1
MKLWTEDYRRTAKLLDEFGSPLHVYDEAQIVEHAKLYTRALRSLGSSGARNFYAVKALPNPRILEILLTISI